MSDKKEEEDKQFSTYIYSAIGWIFGGLTLIVGMFNFIGFILMDDLQMSLTACCMIVMSFVTFPPFTNMFYNHTRINIGLGSKVFMVIFLSILMYIITGYDVFW